MIDPAFWGVIPKIFGSATKQLSSDQFTLVIGYIGMSAKGFDRWNHKQTNASKESHLWSWNFWLWKIGSGIFIVKRYHKSNKNNQR